jgi:hypothetical protein
MRQKDTPATDASRAANGCFSLLPPGAESLPEKRFWKPTAGDSSVNFHKNEIISLDSANPSILTGNGEKRPISGLQTR